MKRPILSAAIAAALVLPASAIAAGSDTHTHVDQHLAEAIAHDPQAPVYIVSSGDTYRGGLHLLARDASTVRDSTGAGLVVSEVRAHQLPEISRQIHDQEHRCGGYFAFASRAEAERFLAGELSAQAVTTTFADYSVDNQATVGPWLPQVAEANIRGTIDHLSNGYPNRYYATSSGRQAAQWIHDTWAGLVAGRDDASVELYNCGNCGGQPSVILTIEGSELPDEIVVLGGHLDSVSNAGSGESMLAPGADDDASGIATLTEVLRVAMADGWKPRRTVKFMGYAAEEVGLRGSNAIAQGYRQQGRNVVGVLQLDMTNHTAGASVDMQLLSDYSNNDLKQFVRDIFDEYLAPLGLTRGSYTCGYGCSDHASWTSAGYPAAMMFEASFNNDLHTRYDTLSNMGGTANGSVPLAKLGLAFLGELAKTADDGDGGDDDDPPTGNELEKGVPVTGLSAGTGNDVAYTFEVPAGASSLSFTMSGGSGDADLYVRRGSAPTDSSYDCRPYRSGNAETCNFAAAVAGIYHVRVKAYAAFSNVSLVADYATAGGGSQTYTNDADYPISDRSTVESAIDVPGRSGNGQASTRIDLDIRHTYRGDLRVDLVAPDGSSYNLHNRGGGSADNLVGSYTVDLSGEALEGRWKLRVNDAYNGDTGYINSWSITF